MKKVYEDTELILIDTQDRNKAFPIYVFSGNGVLHYNYSTPLFYDKMFDNDFDKKILKEIFHYCLNENIYNERLEEFEYTIKSLNDSNKINICKEQIKKIQDGIKYAKREYGEPNARD